MVFVYACARVASLKLEAVYLLGAACNVSVAELETKGVPQVGANLSSLKTKLSAVTAIIATVFAVMAGGAPAHATAAYASNANAVSSGVRLVVEVDNQGHFTLPSGLSSVMVSTTLVIDGTEATSRVGQSFAVSAFIRDTAGAQLTSMPVGSGPYISPYFSTTFFDASNNQIGTSTSNSTPLTVPANTTKIYLSWQGTLAGSGATLPAGQYTLVHAETSNGSAITRGAHVVDAGDVSWNLNTLSFTNPSGIITSSNTGSQSSVTMITCVNSSVVNGSVITPHVMVNGAEQNSSQATAYPYNLTTQNGFSYSPNIQATTVTSQMLTAGLAILATVPVATAGSTNTYDLSVTDASNNEVSAPCPSAVPATPTVSAVAGGGVTASLGTLNSSNTYSCNLYAAGNTSTRLATVTVQNYSSSCSFSGLTVGSSYVVKLSMQGALTNYAPYVYGIATESSASTAVTVPAAGITLTSPSGNSTAGALRVLSGQVDQPTGATYTSSASDGSDGLLYASMVPSAGQNATNYTVKIGHLTPTGADSSFAGSGYATLSNLYSVPDTIQMSPLYNIAPALGWYGARNKWATAFAASPDMNQDWNIVTGTFSSSTVSATSVSYSTLTSFCTNTFGSGAAFSSLRPVSMPSSTPLWAIYCNKQVTLADNSSKSASAAAYVTFTNATTINNVLTLGGFTGGINGYSVYTSANPAAGTSDAGLTAVLTTMNYVSNTTANIVSRNIVRITPALAVTTTASSFSAASTSSTEPAVALEPNNNGTIYLTLTSTSVRLGTLTGSGDITLGSTVTFDSAATTAFSSIASSRPGFTGAAQTAPEGNIFFTRSVTIPSPKTAIFKVNLSTGAATTSEVAAYTTSSSGPSPTFMSATVQTATGDLNWFYQSQSAPTKFTQVRWNSLYVPSGPSSDATASISVNDGTSHSVSNSGTLNVANSVTSVTVTVTPTESHATVGTITGGSNLQVGNNTVSFTVTAQDGSTQSYSFTVVRAAQAASNIATATLTANGSPIGSGSTVNLANGTTSVAVTVTPTESHATYVVTGNTGLVTGNNTVSIVVTAQDTTTTQVYTFTAAVASSNVATATISVNGTTVTDGGSIGVSNATTSVTVVATRTESHATVGTISGASNLAVGDNTVSFTVTAQDGTTTRTYSFTVVRLPSDAIPCLVGTYSTHGGYSSSAQSWSCVNAPAGSFVSTVGASAATPCPAGYFSAAAASTSCTPASLNHYVATTGATAELACPSNTHANSTGATACDPDRVLSSNKNARVTIGGKAVVAGAVLELVGLPAGRLNVGVNLEDIAARAYLSIPANPVLGENRVTLIVQAEDGSRSEQEIVVRITEPVVTPPVVTPPVVTPPVVTPPVVTPPVVTPPVVTPPSKSSDANAVVTVAGISVLDGDHINLPFGTSSVAIVVTPNDSHATYVVGGNSGLQVGTNVMTVTVTAEDGSAKTYNYQLVVAADKSPVNLGVSSASTLQQVQAALDAGRIASFTVTAKGVSASSKVLAQIRAFKTALRASGSTAKVSFAISGSGPAASATVRVTP